MMGPEDTASTFRCEFCGGPMVVQSLTHFSDAADCPACGAIADRGANGRWLTLSGDKSKMCHVTDPAVNFLKPVPFKNTGS
jgi:predicted RNA-binding Zn-ribbon protein involved in translation (DUF1610 family)